MKLVACVLMMGALVASTLAEDCNTSMHNQFMIGIYEVELGYLGVAQCKADDPVDCMEKLVDCTPLVHTINKIHNTDTFVLWHNYALACAAADGIYVTPVDPDTVTMNDISGHMLEYFDAIGLLDDDHQTGQDTFLCMHEAFVNMKAFYDCVNLPPI